jgi:uncharacterized membrane protein YdjX (TVP38/TMEM64 family)
VRGVIVLWIIIIGFLLQEIFAYAFTHEIGLLHALKSVAIDVQKSIMGFGIITYILYILLCAIRPVLFFPASIMTLTAVFLFGPWVALVTSYIGEVASSCVAYYVGKYFGEGLGVTKKISRTKIGHYLRGNAFLSVFVLRIVPIFPFDFVNYASGVIEVPFKRYFLATVLGFLPGLAAFVFLGNSLLHPNEIPLAITCIISLIIAGLLFEKKYGPPKE